jgi:hypothetical protein
VSLNPWVGDSIQAAIRDTLNNTAGIDANIEA